MRTSAPGNNARGGLVARAVAGGFTLIELLVVVAIIAIASAGVTFALRDSADTQLERDAQRLAALLESARAQSRTTGRPVRWRPVDGGFRFEGLPPDTLPSQWLAPTTIASGGTVLLLGPEPIIGRQQVVLTSSAAVGRSLRVGTDGLRPFAVNGDEQP
jgi:general secretion pathway protein H